MPLARNAVRQADETDAPRVVWFHRWHDRLTGGQVKHADYFRHVRCAAGFQARITFANAPVDAAAARERSVLWPARESELAADWTPRPGDVFFLAGTDWRYVLARRFEGRANPRINLIQHVRHAHPGTELHGYLAERAIRVCVSPEVACALEETGAVNGPLVTIPNGLDLAPLPAERQAQTAERDRAPVLVVGYKRPELATELSRHLARADIRHVAVTGFLPRPEFLRLLAESAVAVCLPHREEGFYLPALEAMASRCVTITLDCVGNRSFCTHLRNCLVAKDNAAALAGMIRTALAMSPAHRERLRYAAATTVADHSLDGERRRFQALLADVDDLWREEQAAPGRAPRPAHGPAGTPRAEPLLDFAIVGAQKCGTTALGRFLGQHPEIAFCAGEVHLFDAPDYSPCWTPARINARYRQALGEHANARVRGECTPVYMFLPGVAEQLARYNPRLKLIVLLRDPVQRAISAYYMEKGRGVETKPLWLALLLAPWRCFLEKEPRALGAAQRWATYRRRGLYSKQLRNLYRHFDPAQVLVLQNANLRHHHDAVLQRTFAFLGVAEHVRVPAATVFANTGARKKHRVVRLLLRASYLVETLRLASLQRGPRA